VTVCKKEHPSLCAVLLAAGASRRFGGDNKLLADIGGTPLVRRVAEQLLSSRVAGVVVVTGFEGDTVRGSLAGVDIQFVENTDYAEGLASSLRCGVAALPKGVAGAMIVLADMPGITTALFDRLIGVFEQEACAKIIFPTRVSGAQGNPVIWPSRFFKEMQSLKGDTGAKPLIAAHTQHTIGVRVEDEHALHDIDAPGEETVT
jgi:molybdenum cofactor cytidylyltransferase